MKKLSVLNPYDQSVIEEFEFYSQEKIHEIFEESYLFFKNHKYLKKQKRIEILKKFKELLIREKTRLVDQAIAEGGKPRVHTEIEIERGISGVDGVITALETLSGKEIPMNLSRSSEGKYAYTHYEPRGLCLALSAFNHPFNLAIHQVLPCVAAGAPVIIKPSLATPRSSLSVIELLRESGLPKEAAQWILCEDSVVENLVSDPRIASLNFIGSSKVGWKLRSKVNPGATVTLEHGGVAPLIIDETSDWKTLLPQVIMGCFYHAGQVCVSTQKIFVNDSIYNEFKKEFLSAVQLIQSGDPSATQTLVGPLIRKSAIERVDAWVKEAISMGATLLCGGKKESEMVYAPTVVESVPNQARLASEEVFGPVVTLESYQDFEEVIQKVNDLPYAFQSAVLTKHIDRMKIAMERIKAQTLLFNEHTAFRVDWMPFGGYQDSGLGLGGFDHAIKDQSIEKLIIF
ncbi:MAG: aldehyde dehydrogenase [Bdellovibrionaceae bacterium]|nr:aldehyde dehydrogenase [Pseudobdellovibrionaceae bacterium]|tara:strand:+ start:4252 stop:5625 length:1374 start_codon:yes stop_codon:yes gene_type:complete